MRNIVIASASGVLTMLLLSSNFESRAQTAKQTHHAIYTGLDPLSPAFPRSHEECSALWQEWSRMQQELESAHSACISSGPGGSNMDGASCSRAECQSLHDQRGLMLMRASTASSNCNAAVAEHLREHAITEARRKEADARAEYRRSRREADDADRRAERASNARDAREERSAERARDLAQRAKERLEKAQKALDNSKAALEVASSAKPLRSAADILLNKGVADLQDKGLGALSKGAADTLFGVESGRDTQVDAGVDASRTALDQLPGMNPVSKAMTGIAVSAGGELTSRGLATISDQMNAFSVDKPAAPDLGALSRGLGAAVIRISDQTAAVQAAGEQAAARAGLAGQVDAAAADFSRRSAKSERSISNRLNFEREVIAEVKSDMEDAAIRTRSRASSSSSSKSTSKPTKPGDIGHCTKGSATHVGRCW